MRLNPPVATTTAQAARKLRQAMTDAEQRLWFRLRAKRLAGLHFRRQHPIPPYVADFCCVGAKLLVEIDGSQHSETSDA